MKSVYVLQGKLLRKIKQGGLVKRLKPSIRMDLLGAEEHVNM